MPLPRVVMLVVVAAAASLHPVAAAAGPLVGNASYGRLLDGVPVTGSVAYLQENFYQITLPLPLPRLDIIVLGTSGNPDMYVTAGPYWDPVPGNSEWHTYGVAGAGVVSLPFNASFTALGGYCRLPEYTNCSINVGVYGSRAANYTLVLTTSTGAQKLIDGLPSFGSLPPQTADYYNFSVPAGGSVAPPSAVSFSVNMLQPPAAAAGKGLGLFVASSAQGSSRPDPANNATYCAAALSSPLGASALTVTIANTSGCACQAAAGCSYFGAVVNMAEGDAADSSTYTIVATTSSSPVITLLDGTPFAGSSVATGPPVLFLFSASLSPSQGIGAVELVLVPSQGMVRMFVSVGEGGAGPPGPGNAAFVSSGGGSLQLLTISATDPILVASCGGGDPNATVTCPVHIAVVCSSVSSAWSMTARAGAYVTLVNGLPTEGSAPAGGLVAYYRFTMQQAAQPLTITADALSGQLAVYVGCDSDNATTKPSPNSPASYIWAAATLDGSALVIDPATDPRACIAPCTYYIGVTSSDPARGTGFVVLAHADSAGGAAFPLALGDVVLDSVPHGKQNGYYLFFEPSAPSITLSLLAQTGNAAMFARIENGSSPSIAQPTTASNAQYVVQPEGSGAWESVVLTQSDGAFLAANCPQLSTEGAPCVVLTGVLGNTSGSSAASTYLISASADIRQLSDGIPVQGVVQVTPAIAYFRYTSVDRAPFTVIVTPLSGDPDLLVAVQARPNATWSQWSSLSPAIETVSVQWTEPWLNPALTGLTYPIDFYIGVSGWDSAAEFSLVVQSNPFVLLESGIEQAAQATAAQLTYLLLNIPSTTATGVEVGFTVVLTPISGDAAPRMYVNTVNYSIPSCAHCGWPYCTTTPCQPSGVRGYNRHWSSDEALNPLVIDIDVTDPNYEQGEQYIIAVSTQTEAQFLITATYSTGIITLSNQIPMEGGVQAGAYAFYTLNIVNPAVQLLMLLTPLSGSPELYVSANSSNRRPTSAAYDKRAVAGDGGVLAVIFDWAELPECPDSSVDHTVYCHVFLSVYGGAGANATFTLLGDAAKPNASTFLLTDGVPQVGVVVQSDYVQYYAYVHVPPTQSYSVTLNPGGTAKLDLYVTMDGSRPSETNYQYASQAVNGPEQITVSPGTPGYNASCVMRAAVHHPFVDVVSFDITYESSDLTQLLQGTPTAGNTQTAQTRFFQLRASSPPELVAVSLTGVYGSPQLWAGIVPVGNATWRPGPNSSCTNGTLIGSGMFQALHIAPGDPCSCPAGACTYIVGIACPGTPYKNPPCFYTLSGTAGLATATTALTDGTTLFDAVDSRVSPYRYFTFDMSIMLLASGNLTITARSGGGGNGAPLQLLATSARGALPTLDNGLALWNSNTTGPPGGTATLSVAFNDAPMIACPHCTLLTIAVLGTRSAQPGGGVSSFRVTASTTVGNPQVLALGAPSTPVTGNYRAIKQFVVFLGSTDYDLLIDVTALAGRAVVSVDPYNPTSRCTVGPPPNRLVVCNGMWSSGNASITAAPLRIRAADPCANADPNRTDCVGPDPQHPAAWRPGPYYVSVLIVWSSTTYILTAAQPDAAMLLVDAEPQRASTSVAFPAMFSFSPESDPSQAAIRVTLSAEELAVSFFVLSCGGSAARSCTVADTHPGPSNPAPQASAVVSDATALTLTIGPDSPVYCLPASDAYSCTYYIGVYPPAGCDPKTCSAAFSIVGSTTAGGTPLDIAWADVQSRVAVVASGLSPVTGSSALELYLSPFANGPVDIVLTLDACGTGAPPPKGTPWAAPSIFVCDPSIPAPLGCTNPFQPSASEGQFTSSAATSFSSGGTSRAAVTIPQTIANMLYVSIAAANAPPHAAAGDALSAAVGAAADTLPTFSLMLSALGDAPYLVLPQGGANVTIATSGGVPSVRWAAPTIVSADGTSVLAAAVGLTYDVYFAPVGFSASVASLPGVHIVATTACGLDRWGSYASASISAAVILRGVAGTELSLSSAGLLPGQQYEAGVTATCNSSCWSRSLGAHGGSLTPQRVAYGTAIFNASSIAPSPAPGPSGMTSGVIAGAIGGGVLLVALICAGACYVQRARAGGHYMRLAHASDMLVPRSDAGFAGEEGDVAAASSVGAAASTRGSYDSPQLPGSGSLRPVAQRVTQLRASLATPTLGGTYSPPASPPLIALGATRQSAAAAHAAGTGVTPPLPPVPSPMLGALNKGLLSAAALPSLVLGGNTSGGGGGRAAGVHFTSATLDRDGSSATSWSVLKS